MEFSEIIREIMFDSRINQCELAALLDVNQTTVGQWKSGKKKPGYDNIVKIYETLGITPDEICGVTEITRKLDFSNLIRKSV